MSQCLSLYLSEDTEQADCVDKKGGKGKNTDWIKDWIDCNEGMKRGEIAATPDDGRWCGHQTSQMAEIYIAETCSYDT